MEEYFKPYYDENENLHIDARESNKKINEIKNYKVYFSELENEEKQTKLIIHNVNYGDNSKMRQMWRSFL